jgi:hypothetical protein
MLSVGDIPIFLNEDFIDELWIRIKRAGLTKERIEEASTRVGARAKLGGLGKLWDLLLPDIGAEISGETDRKSSQRLEINSVLRALFLPELIPEILDVSEGAQLSSVGAVLQGSFARIICDNIAMTPIPTLASYLRQLAYESHMENADEKDAKVSIPAALKMLDSVTSSNRAMAFAIRTNAQQHGPASLVTLMRCAEEEMLNALSVCQDDHYLAASTLGAVADVVVFSVLDEGFVKRSLIAFSGIRPVSYFGQVAYRSQSSDGTTLVGIRAAAISLC